MPYKFNEMKSLRQKERRKGEAPLKPLSEASVTVRESMTLQGLTNEHPVMKYLIDKPYRAKMEAIIQALNVRKLTSHVNLGCGRNALSLDVVEEMLEVTAK